MLRSVYDNLVWSDHTLTPRPELAESWSSTPDAKEWTFNLRKGVKFHHGRELDADDVVFTFQRIFNPATASPARSVFSMVENIFLVGRLTIPGAEDLAGFRSLGSFGAFSFLALTGLTTSQTAPG